MGVIVRVNSWSMSCNACCDACKNYSLLRKIVFNEHFQPLAKKVLEEWKKLWKEWKKSFEYRAILCKAVTLTWAKKVKKKLTMQFLFTCISRRPCAWYNLAINPPPPLSISTSFQVLEWFFLVVLINFLLFKLLPSLLKRYTEPLYCGEIAQR